MSGTTSGTGGLDRRALIRSGAAGVAGGLAAWTAPAILLATPAMASTMYYAQYSDFEGSVSQWKWETTTDPLSDPTFTTNPDLSMWTTCKPSGWPVGVNPSTPVLVPVPTASGNPTTGPIVFTAHSTCRIKEAVATIYSPAASGVSPYKCSVLSVPNPDWTGNTATFPALTIGGDSYLAFRFRMECGS